MPRWSIARDAAHEALEWIIIVLITVSIMRRS